jgi:hypothetical protein
MGKGVNISWVGKYHGGSIYHTRGGGLVFNKGVQYTMDEIYPGVNLPWGSKYHMTPVRNKMLFYQ